MARCAACGTDEALIYRCPACGTQFCEPHHDPASHNCAEGHSWTAATATGERDFGRRPHRQRGTEAPTVDRPGYGPEAHRPAEGARTPRTVREWLRQQTYLSLTLKTAGLATLLSVAVYGGWAFLHFGWLPM